MKKALYLLCLCLMVSTPVAGQAIKLGSLAPEGSPWDRALEQLMSEGSELITGRLVSPDVIAEVKRCLKEYRRMENFIR